MPIAPFIPLLAAGISSGVGLYNDARNREAQQRANNQAQEYNLLMYGQQLKDQRIQYQQSRMDALSDYKRQRKDSLSDYYMQNQYNSPLEQMQRYKDAGLNPHLIYGQQPQSAAAVRSNDTRSADKVNPDYKSFQPGVERYREDLSSIPPAIGSYYDIQLKAAQTDNIKAMNTVATQEALLKAAQTSKTLIDTKTSEYNLDLANQLRTSVLERATQEVKRISAEIDLKKQQTGLTGQQTKNIKTDIRLKEIDENLREKGISPQDPLYMRIMAQALDDPKKTWAKMKSYIFNLIKK